MKGTVLFPYFINGDAPLATKRKRKSLVSKDAAKRKRNRPPPKKKVSKKKTPTRGVAKQKSAVKITERNT